MKTATRYRSFALLVLLFSGNRFAFGWQGDVPPERAALSGAWTVNKDLSDKQQMPGAAERGARAGQPPPGRGGGIGGFGGGRGRGGAPGGGGDRPNPELQAQMRAVLEVPDRLMITIEADAVIFTYGDGRTQRMLTNGKKEKLKIGLYGAGEYWAQLTQRVEMLNGRNSSLLRHPVTNSRRPVRVSP